MGWAFEQENMHFSVKQKKSPQRRLSTSQEGYSPCGRDCEAEAAEAQLRRTPVVGSHPPGTKKVAQKATVYVPGGILSLRSRLRSGSCRSAAPTNPRRGFSPSWNEKSRPKGDCLRPRRDTLPAVETAKRKLPKRSSDEPPSWVLTLLERKKSPQRRLSTSQEGYSPCGRDCEAEAAEAQLRRTPVVGSHPPGTKKVAPEATVYVPGGIRTPDRALRRRMLYPAELLGQKHRL